MISNVSNLGNHGYIIFMLQSQSQVIIGAAADQESGVALARVKEICWNGCLVVSVSSWPFCLAKAAPSILA